MNILGLISQLIGIKTLGLTVLSCLQIPTPCSLVEWHDNIKTIYIYVEKPHRECIYIKSLSYSDM